MNVTRLDATGEALTVEHPRRRILGGILGALGLIPFHTVHGGNARACERRCGSCERCRNGKCVSLRNRARCRKRGDTAPPARPSPTIAGCPIFPANNIWNTRIDALPVHPLSDAYVSSIGSSGGLGPDFSVPYAVVSGDQPRVPVRFGWRSGPALASYPIPPDAPIEVGIDHHVVVLDTGDCTLYELYDARRDGVGWSAFSGAHWDLDSNALLRDGLSTADAAGLPMLPGLLRYEEVAAGFVGHAVRFTAPRTQKAHVWPARNHASSSDDPKLPPMGQRFRLRADFDVSDFSPRTRVILTALKHFGLILADNGGPWVFQGAPHEEWHDADPDLHQLRLGVHGRDFEAVDATVLMKDVGSAVAK